MRNLIIASCWCALLILTDSGDYNLQAQTTLAAPGYNRESGKEFVNESSSEPLANRNKNGFRTNKSSGDPCGRQTRRASQLANNAANLGKIKWIEGVITARDARVGPEQLPDRHLPLGTVSAYNTLIPRTTEYLVASGFGFSVPEAVAITGVVVRIGKKKSVLGSVSDAEVRLVVGGMPAGDNNAQEHVWPSDEGVTEYGSSANRWGIALSPATINDDDFGIVLSARMTPFGNFQTAQVNSVSVTIYWRSIEAFARNL